MKLGDVAGLYAVVMGVAIASMWTVLIGTGQAEEIETEPIRISFHLAGEFITAAALIAGGLGLIFNAKWGFTLYFVSMGMLSYTVVVSPGYYGQEGEYAFVVMFAVFMAITALLIACALKDESLFRTHSREKKP
ncbi:MAG: hypothetical protein JSV90_05445 [Methanobacteriota archaeon]|nr:MAG: hypothetical protein JSV90_05445 [Euryarchaeota archaeon]